MKYIFDFDDVIFDSFRFKKEKLFLALSHKNVTVEQIQEIYKKRFTSPENLFRNVASKCNIALSAKEQKSIIESIFTNISSFLHLDTVEVIQKKGKSNCVILSLGDSEFQKRKINTVGMDDFVFHVEIVANSKKEWVIDFAKKYKTETVYFIDNTKEHLNHPEFSLLPNLKTILYVGPESLKTIQ